MRVVLIGNYPRDRQESMLRFGALLERGWNTRKFNVTSLRPESTWLGRRSRRNDAGAGKWLGYFDKYVVFPRRLARCLCHTDHETVIHVLDHSNTVYVPTAKRSPWIVTCHDLLAVRGALGEDTDCPASVLGRRLQRAVVAGLSRASAVVADSGSTLQDVNRLVAAPAPQMRSVIHLALNHPYRARERTEAIQALAGQSGVPWARPFIFHVGSNLPRKNKSGVLRVFSRVVPGWDGNLVFAGATLTTELRHEAARYGVLDRVFAVPALSDSELESAYSLAHALVFPSKCEGFGWPVIEAQACGCPVVCSDRTSLPEIAGNAGIVRPFDDESGMAQAVVQLNDAPFRRALVARGFENVQRFELNGMLDRYQAVYAAAVTAFQSQ